MSLLEGDQVALGSGGITIPGGVEQMCRCGAWRCPLEVNMAVLGSGWTQ